MSRHKTRKLAEIKSMANVFEDARHFRGKWKQECFGNDNPIVLELGCGKGEYSIALAKKFPGKNFIGIDIKGARLWRAAKDANACGSNNVVFLKALIEQIEDYFSISEVTEIWIPFPDPYPKPSKSKKRLISSKFLNFYSKILIPDGIIHFKTDNEKLYEYALNTLKAEGHLISSATEDLYNSGDLNEYNSIPSYFETLFLEQGKTIRYIRFSLTSG
jgi:tRNA (guanine-N7-)-methyltransferase